MTCTNVYFSEKQSVENEVTALKSLFGLKRDEIGFSYADKGKKLYISNNGFMDGDFKHILMIDADDEILPSYKGPAKDGDGIDYSMYDFPRRLSIELGVPLVGEALDWDNNKSVHRKFYPDGREEDIETPDDE